MPKKNKVKRSSEVYKGPRMMWINAAYMFILLAIAAVMLGLVVGLPKNYNNNLTPLSVNASSAGCAAYPFEPGNSALDSCPYNNVITVPTSIPVVPTAPPV